MSDAELESLLSPLGPDAPCGPDLEYDPAFLAMQEAGAGKPEQQYGDTVIPAQEPDWPVVHEQALQLAARTRDLRVAVWLARSGAHLSGLAGAVRGLQLAQRLLERHWEGLHPQLDALDNDDPTARVNALLPLLHPAAGLADLRSASLTGRRGALTVRDLELALAHVEPHPGEPVPTEEGVVQGVTAAIAETPALAQILAEGLAAVQALSENLDRRLASTQAPDFAPLKRLLQCAAEAGRRAAGDAPAGAQVPAVVATPTTIVVQAGIGAIASREDAIRALERACEWIERNEPSNPAPLLIRRSQRLMNRNFIDIVRELLPEGLDQIEKLAGTPRP
ncbi:type VI secretion system protein TssA [Ramlibacter monticola]|uniref:Type VI secretion system protein TssA n=1 Tax=Ramlibacter monticola TaxID=1926872 RepID=A0A936Z3B3_9BURK|nr:type VI secretion system protein TssA [Ramlibacter monticola]MBL0392815.1 type VI secretion system protein TssA [Ramlibacter monticola]